MNKPRGGNIPGIPIHREVDPPPNERYGLVQKMESGLAEPERNTLRNRRLAKDNGWSEAEYLHWVDTGEPPIRSTVKETPATRSDEIDDDERLHHE
jgi:hypothetical protein